MKKIILIGFWPDYESIFFRNTQLENAVVELINPKEMMEKYPLFRYLPRPIRNRIFRSIIIKAIKANPAAIILLQEFRLILETIEKYQPKISGGVMMRNVVDESSKLYPLIQKLKANRYQFWSFDRSDCNKYGFHFYRQFVDKISLESPVTRKADFIFIGRDKGRLNWLLDFKAESEKRKFKTIIDVRSNTKIGAGNKERKGGTKTYNNYLKSQLRGRCVLDIVQKGQEGMTLRPLEALLYGQKVLTNNISVKKLEIYHPSNIYVIEDELDFDEISHFMSQPMSEVDNKILSLHSTKSVLNQIMGTIQHQTTGKKNV